MMANRFGIIFVLTSMAFTYCLGDEKQDAAIEEVDTFEAIALKWVDARGRDDEDRLSKQMEIQRDKVIKIGELAIPRVCELLKHRQVNVRRGSAIILVKIVEQQSIRDEDLLDFVLLRMVEDEDIKARSNLYHVAHALIENMKPNKKP